MADNTSDVSIEDAVYADLAIRHYLTNVSVESFDGNSQDSININVDKQWVPASTVKTYVAMYAYKQIQDNKLSLNDFILIDPKNVVSTELETEELPVLAEGQSVSVERLIKQMIIQSDNTAYNVLLDVLDRQEISKYIQSLGLTNSVIGSKLNLDSNQQQSELNVSAYSLNVTTVQDYSRAFDLIKRRKIPGANELFTILSEQKINNMLPLFLPKNVTVAHKTGDLDPLYHDGGIIIGPNRSYILSVFSNLGDPSIIAHVSQLVYTKDLSLIGASIPNTAQSSENIYQPIDPLVLNPNPNQQLLGTKDMSNVQVPSINASDLGIKPSDLSLDLGKHELPQVIIPADSPVHFLVTVTQLIRGVFIPKSQRQLDNLNLKLAEVGDLESRSNNKKAGEILQTVQKQLNSLAKDQKVGEDTKVQTAIQSISETRFTLLGKELDGVNKAQKNETIKAIANQARETLTQIQPNIPQAISETSLSQKPLIGQVTDVSDSQITVKTASGPQVTVPLTKEIRIKEKDKTNVPTSASSISVGTSIALIGSSQGKNFKASFILTNLPRQLVAPPPAIVLKVNQANKTMVISQNGGPIQVNTNSQTVIKGTGTNLSFNSIKPNDVIIVHGENVTPQKNGQNASTPSASSKSPSSSKESPKPGPAGASIQGNNNQNQKDKNAQPAIIKGTTIQIIEKHKDSAKKPSAPETKAQDQKPSSTPTPNKDDKPKKSSFDFFEFIFKRLLTIG